jgi:septum site-determining protein MinD
METRFISIISGKGGVGKSTVAANLGASLASKFKRSVVVIDCNLTTSHLSLSLGMYYCPITLNNVLRGEKNILEVLYDHPSGMKIVPASLNLKDLEKIDISKLKDVIKYLKGRVEFVILDASPGLGRETYSAIHASDEVIFVTNPNLPAAVDVIKCKELVENVNKLPIGIVLNMVSKKSYELTKKEIETLTQLPVLASIPHDRDIHKSLAKKMPVVSFKPKSKSSRELIKLAGLLVGEKEKKSFIKLF